MVDALASDFVERLRLTGIPEWRIVFAARAAGRRGSQPDSHGALRCALVSGIVVVELVFAYPGLGQELVRGVTRREVHVVQAIALCSAGRRRALNLLADLAILATRSAHEARMSALS
jgi:peptide/nickel transport system permease protein